MTFMNTENAEGFAPPKMTLAMAYNIAVNESGPDLYHASDQRQTDRRQQRLRILWVKVGGLWPVNTGGRLRSFNMLEALCEYHDVTVMTTHGPGECELALTRELPKSRKVFSFPHAPPKSKSWRFLLYLMRSWFSGLPVDLLKNRVESLRQAVEQSMQTGNFDLCVADFLFAVPNVSLNSPVPVIFFSHNVEYMIWKRLCENTRNPLKRLLLALEWRKIRRCEKDACRQAEHTITVSADDRLQLSNASGSKEISSIPTGVDCAYFNSRQSPDTEERTNEIVFTGSMDWHPNEDAMLYFMESVLPLIRSRLPEVSLTIAGRNPSRRLRKAADARGVHVTGTVDDIRPYIERASVYIVPLRVGGGTRLKIFEALAMGKAVVSTTIGAEGLPLEEGEHILRADDPMSFASAVLSLIANRKLRARLGRRGRQLVLDHYSWSRVAENFESLCGEVVTR